MKEEEKRKETLASKDIQNCISILEYLSENGDQLVQLSEEQRVQLMKVAGQISRPDRIERKKRNKGVKLAKKQAIDTINKKARAASSIRSARLANIFEAPLQIALPEGKAEKQKLTSEQNCYVCKKKYLEIHHFYDAMCTECGDLNYIKIFICEMFREYFLFNLHFA